MVETMASVDNIVHIPEDPEIIQAGSSMDHAHQQYLSNIVGVQDINSDTHNLDSSNTYQVVSEVEIPIYHSGPVSSQEVIYGYLQENNQNPIIEISAENTAMQNSNGYVSILNTSQGVENTANQDVIVSGSASHENKVDQLCVENVMTHYRHIQSDARQQIVQDHLGMLQEVGCNTLAGLPEEVCQIIRRQQQLAEVHPEDSTGGNVVYVRDEETHEVRVFIVFLKW